MNLPTNYPITLSNETMRYLYREIKKIQTKIQEKVAKTSLEALEFNHGISAIGRPLTPNFLTIEQIYQKDAMVKQEYERMQLSTMKRELEVKMKEQERALEDVRERSNLLTDYFTKPRDSYSHVQALSKLITKKILPIETLETLIPNYREPKPNFQNPKLNPMRNVNIKFV